MNYKDLFKYLTPSLSFFNKNIFSKDELFKDIYEHAFKQNYVTEEFLEKIELREEKFPTGIELGTIGAAIPHTDAEYVKNEFVSIYVLEEPIIFQSMEDSTQDVQVSIVFVLGIKEAHSQLEMLQTLIALMQDEDLIHRFKGLKNFGEMKLLLTEEGEKKNEKN